MNSTYIGDGVYLSPGRFQGELVLTVNHHEPNQATDVIWMEPAVVSRLIQTLNDYAAELQNKQP